ncbi:MAG TPA: DNA repair protein RecO [Anaeromyxobacteraceae bacterium]|nr:DNA repair protein RecO [Anaeromyxobacteraceae bacterium]
MVRSAKLRAIVLRSVDYGERDRVVTLLSRERGKLSAFARGARASRRRFGGTLEPFNLLAAELRERTGADTWILENAAVERAFGAIRGDLARIACAGYAGELAGELVRDAEPHEDLFDLLVAYLARLDEAPARPWDLRGYELGALRATGLMPRLDGCARCGGPASPGAMRFDPAHGGVLCQACRAFGSPASRELPGDTLAGLRRLQRGEEEAPPPARVAAEARDLLTAYLEHHLGRRLKARRFLDEVGPLLGG